MGHEFGHGAWGEGEGGGHTLPNVLLLSVVRSPMPRSMLSVNFQLFGGKPASCVICLVDILDQ